jgi:regulatory protein
MRPGIEETSEPGTEETGGEPEADGGSDDGKALALAYRFLNRRERTVAEVRARLEKAEIREQQIDAAVSELIELGYLDDARYARVFTQDKRTLEAWGSERIARALRERGVERDLIELALAESASAQPTRARAADGGGFAEVGDERPGSALDGELARAVALLQQRFPAGPVEPRDRERAFGVLARKGYESETAADAVREWARNCAGMA